MEADYLNGVLITESKVDPVDGHEFSEEERLLHSRLGVITELGELIDIYKKHIYYGKPLDLVHVGEEIGDCFWYIGLGFNVCGIIAANPKQDVPVHGTDMVAMLELGMHIFTNPEIAYEDRLQYIFKTMLIIIKVTGLDYQEILDKNLAKLRKRYGDSFDADRAINRNLEAEREVLDA
jgi:NTP pyrophosphatase (non-canonical NTP hydrolase)